MNEYRIARLLVIAVRLDRAHVVLAEAGDKWFDEDHNHLEKLIYDGNANGDACMLQLHIDLLFLAVEELGLLLPKRSQDDSIRDYYTDEAGKFITITVSGPLLPPPTIETGHQIIEAFRKMQGSIMDEIEIESNMELYIT